MRNLAAALLLAHGTPMVQMGDEYGHTKVDSCLETSTCLLVRKAVANLQACSSALESFLTALSKLQCSYRCFSVLAADCASTQRHCHSTQVDSIATDLRGSEVALTPA